MKHIELSMEERKLLVRLLWDREDETEGKPLAKQTNEACKKLREKFNKHW